MREKARSSPGCGTGQKIDGGGKRKLNTRGVPGRRLPGFCGREKTPVKGVKRIGHYTRELPVRLFENFYRNGSMIFGGGHVLVPLLFTEFVEFKHYLNSEEFLVGFAFVQAVPGPVFSFCSYVGALSMREYGILGEIAGGLIASAGIFLPGTFLIYFLIRFWDSLKQYRVIRASIEGITAASTGLLLTATIFLMQPIELNVINLIIILVTFTLLNFIRSMAPLLIILGLIAGLFF